MSLRRNILANYVSQFYVAAVGILTVPLYVRHMGTEAYGLIGFYTMLQAWFQMLDAGLSTTLAREASRFSGGAGDAASLAKLSRVLERVFLMIGAFGVLAFFAGAGTITHRWLQVGRLPPGDVTNSVQLMGLIIGCRWMSCLYRGVVTGFERQVWLGTFNVGVATARFVVYLPILIFVDNATTSYFAYQVAVAALEAIGLYWKARGLLPQVNAHESRRVENLRAPLVFASGVAFTSVIWVLLTQFDKLLLSKLLPLAVFGEFSLAVLLSGGINLIATPIGAALLPRMTSTAAAKDESALRSLYGRYAQLTCVVIFPAAFTLLSCATQVLFAWTGNEKLAKSASLVLGLYSVGNALMGVSAFAYYIQYAKGNIRMHLIGNALLAAIYLPGLFLAARTHGAEGAATAWLIMNAVYLAVWVPLVHAALVPGLHARWFWRDVLPVIVAAAVPTLVTAMLPADVLAGVGRWAGALYALIFFLVSLGCATAASSVFRSRITLLVLRQSSA